MPKVLIADKLSPAAVAIFRERGVDADVKTGLTKEELIKIVVHCASHGVGNPVSIYHPPVPLPFRTNLAPLPSTTSDAEHGHARRGVAGAS